MGTTRLALNPIEAMADAMTSVLVAALDEYLAPFVARLTEPEPLVYSIPQAAKVLGTSQHTVRRLVNEGHLVLVPHMGERRLIPRAAVETLVAEAMPSTTPPRKLEVAS